MSKSFWDHLDELRSTIVRIIVVTFTFGIIAFILKDQLYTIILAPKQWDFITYRCFNDISNVIIDLFNLSNHTRTLPQQFHVDLINTDLAGQFIVHIKTSVFISALAVLPYILYQLFNFISPGLYDNERRVSSRVVFSSYIMFMLGVAITYFLIFPLTFKFLGTYQVSENISNTITIQSYLGSFTMLSLAMGIVFEIPVLSWLLAKAGILNASLMRNYRRHIIVALLIIAAIITPTTDIFTLILVALPMYLLYETSIIIVGKTKNK